MTDTSFADLINALGGAQTVEELHATCVDFSELYEFDQFLYGARFPTSFVQPKYIIISSYPAQWRERYTQQDYMKIDPAVRYCEQHCLPYNWQQIQVQADADTKVRNFMQEARDFGLHSGVSFPLHSAFGESAMLNLASQKSMQQSQLNVTHALPFAQLFAAHLHEAIRKVFSQEALPLSKIQLTHRERECLCWAAEGKTAWETGQILSISERTVVYHVQNAASKLKVVNRQQAVARAISQGLLHSAHF